MKKLLFISLLFFVCCNTFAQLKVETIEQNKEVLNFLNRYYLKAKKITLTVDYYSNSDFRNKWSDKRTFDFFDQQNVYHWIKVDLNKDGKLDLIWNGCINKTASVIAFVSDKKNGYSVTVISDSSEDQTLHLIKPYNTDGFILTRINPTEVFGDTSYHFEDRFIYDTITLNNNVFVEYNTLGIKYILDTIICSPKGVFVTRYDTIKICRNGKILFSQEFYEKDRKRILVSSKMLSKDSVKSFFSIVDDLPFYSFKKSYRYVANSIRDASTLHFDFIFKNGKKQKLSVYHTCAPFGIKIISDLVKKLRNDQGWGLESNSLVDY